MKAIYFLLSVTGFISMTVALSTSLYSINNFDDVIIVALHFILLAMCLVGMIVNFDYVANLIKKSIPYRFKRKT